MITCINSFQLPRFHVCLILPKGLRDCYIPIFTERYIFPGLSLKCIRSLTTRRYGEKNREHEAIKKHTRDSKIHSFYLDDHSRVVLQGKEDSDYINATMIEVCKSSLFIT